MLGRRRWWATRLVVGYAAACALLGILHLVDADVGGLVGEALVVLALPTSLLALSLVSVAEMTLNALLPETSTGWTVLTVAIWSVALVVQTVLVGRRVVDDSRTVRADRATQLVRSPHRWSPRRFGRPRPTTGPPGHGRTVRI